MIKRWRNSPAKGNGRDLIYISERKRIVIREGKERKRKKNEGRGKSAKQ